jgi:multidrug efflux system membrane fusion protein
VRVVKLGPVQGDNVSIDEGLAPGDQVVVDGADKLREGAKVEPSSKYATPSGGGGGRKVGGAGGERKSGGADGERRRGTGSAANGAPGIAAAPAAQK